MAISADFGHTGVVLLHLIEARYAKTVNDILS